MHWSVRFTLLKLIQNSGGKPKYWIEWRKSCPILARYKKVNHFTGNISHVMEKNGLAAATPPTLWARAMGFRSYEAQSFRWPLSGIWWLQFVTVELNHLVPTDESKITIIWLNDHIQRRNISDLFFHTNFFCVISHPKGVILLL